MNHTLTRIYCCCFDEESGNIYINNEKNGKFHFSFTRRWVLQSSGQQEQLLPATYVIFIQSQFIIILLSLPKKITIFKAGIVYMYTHQQSTCVQYSLVVYTLFAPSNLCQKKIYETTFALFRVLCWRLELCPLKIIPFLAKHDQQQVSKVKCDMLL